ncbi:hypothetical protein HYFRA_00008781 [Hymenoscyphus fraxineus]|uniref:Glycoside hydrolase family 43 protein n=1 Tax=Hymenoscyphus fraxineus TaxID=746836 RepID=A0A9N9PUS3_9HELO|nr:hypothetical protein HYFRA_00008781 [Hymenoscyphus fraxineus]
MSFKFLSIALLFARAVTSSPVTERDLGKRALEPVLKTNFPDPAVIYDVGTAGGAFLAFATEGNGHKVQVAQSSNGWGGPWNLLNRDLLPNPGAWSTGNAVWAPDVRKIGSKYVLYYAAQTKADVTKHCVGSATADNVLGPYTAQSEPIDCSLVAGGAIDISGFTDTDGKRYVVYKIDGNGLCGNPNKGPQATPLMLQEMAGDGITKIGEPTKILDKGPGDGPLIEAPNLIKVNGIYIVFFSSNCFNSGLYDISYATATSIKGPYTKAAPALLLPGNSWGLVNPGGAQATDDGKGLVFHADCLTNSRCMHYRDIKIEGRIVTFV